MATPIECARYHCFGRHDSDKLATMFQFVPRPLVSNRVHHETDALNIGVLNGSRLHVIVTRYQFCVKRPLSLRVTDTLVTLCRPDSPSHADGDLDILGAHSIFHQEYRISRSISVEEVSRVGDLERS